MNYVRFIERGLLSSRRNACPIHHSKTVNGLFNRVALLMPSPSDASVLVKSCFCAQKQDAVVIRGLQVAAFIGVHDFERTQRQGMRFDIEIETVPAYTEIVRQTGKYVSYADAVEYIQTRAASDEHIDLVETWAEDVATFILQNELASAVRVSVQKTEVFDAVEGVGVVIYRRSSKSNNKGARQLRSKGNQA
ncbi:MAG: dihydroneopterin aldolase [Hyphomicrobiaceae bacterium]